jgi:tetraprenyl-beta-curcumene synthase
MSCLATAIWRGRLRELASAAYVMARFWLSVHPLVRRQLHEWEEVARTIPDPRLRALALATLRDESLSAMGAALVATTSPVYRPALVRLLVALQLAWDYIDTLAEQPAADPFANGVQLHRALVDAIDAGPPRDDYYRFDRGGDDGGYLRALVARCRSEAAELPALERVRPIAARELEVAEIQYANHLPPPRREALLRAWADRRGDDHDARWFELAAAASSSLGVLALLALAADPAVDDADVERVHAAYVPWVDALTALLDGLVDRPTDVSAGLSNWIDHYPSDAAAAERLADVTTRAVAGARSLPNGGRHVAIVTGMIAMHLSQPTAQLPDVQPATRAVLRAADTPVMALLLLLLRGWRGVRARVGAYSDADRAVPTPTPTGQLTPVPPSPQ